MRTQVLAAVQMYKLPPLTMTCPLVPELLLYKGAALLTRLSPWNPKISYIVRVILPVRPATDVTLFVS